MTTYIIVFVLYFLALLAISIYANTYNKNKNDYLLGGRRLGVLTTSISAGASDMSAWLFLGLPGAVYLSGANQIWIAVGLTVGTFLNWRFVAYGVRTLTETNNNSTIPSFLASNIIGNAYWVKLSATVVIIIFFSIYVASGFTAGAVLLSSFFNIPYLLAMILTVVFIALYIFIGGYLAVAWTDLIQGLIMIVIIILIPTLVLFNVNFNINVITNNILSNNANAFNIFFNTSFIGVLSLLSWGLGYFGQPHILSRFMGIKNPEKLKQARNINVIWTSVGMFFAVVVGLLASGYFSTPLDNAEKAMLELAIAVAPAVVVGFVGVAIVSAVVSTANSQLLVAASSLVEDLPFKINIPSVLLFRVSVVLIALLAFVLAYYSKSGILLLVGYAWAGFGASFGPLILMLANGKKVSSKAGLSGILVGCITVIIWKNLNGGLFNLYELLPAFILSFIVIVVVNKLTLK